MDVAFIEFARAIVDRVDERFGRLTAWLVAVGSVVALTAGVLIVAPYLLS